MLYPRIIKPMVVEGLRHFPVVFLTGARQVGKSTLAFSLIDNYITLDDITVYSAAKADPMGFINGLKKPVVIDEIQKVPELLSAIKYDVDKNRTKGRYLLTGSANILSYKNIADTLAGRLGIFELFPLSCKEISGKSENVIDFFYSQEPHDLKIPFLDQEKLLSQIIKGGYPEIQKIDTQQGRYLWLSSYIRTYIERDVRDIGELRDIDKFIRSYNILASRSGNLLNKLDICRSAGVDIKTLDNYIKLLETVYQVWILTPYSKNIGKRFTKTGKIFLTDSGILCHLLGISDGKTLLSSPYRGNIFETFVFSELLKAARYSEIITNIFFYRTQDKKEIDFIIERPEGVIAIEVKLSQTINMEDFKHIIYLKRNLPEFKRGYLIYIGERVLPFGEGLFALPAGVFF